MAAGSQSCPCPACGETKSKVLDGRPTATSRTRRRKCVGCGHRFTTWEVTDPVVAGAMVAELVGLVLKDLNRADFKLQRIMRTVGSTVAPGD